MKLRLPRRRIWRVTIYISSLLLVLLAADMIWVQTRRTIHPGFDTTRIVSPVQADGSVDYLLAIDDRFGVGVTPQNNAAIPLLRALGRQVLASYQPPDALTDRLGMEHLPETGDYFIPYEKYCNQHAVAPSEWYDWHKQHAWPVKFDESTLQWIKENEKPLALMTEASGRPRLFIPFYCGVRTETLIEIQLKHLPLLRDVSRALQVRALARLSTGDVAGFKSDLLTVRRLARLIGHGPTMIERLVACSIDTSACQAGRIALGGGALRGVEIPTLAAEFAQLGDLPSIADSLDYGERYFALDTLQVIARRGPMRAGSLLKVISDPPGTNFAPVPFFEFMPIPYEAAMRQINIFNDGALAVMREPTYPRRMASLTLLENQTQWLEGKPLSTLDLTGPNWPVRLFAPALRNVLKKEENARMESRLTQLALMLAAYKAEHGEHPTALADLITPGAPNMTDDLFSSKPLIYARTATGYTLYSVGPNMIDDGGKSEKPADDIIASSPLP